MIVLGIDPGHTHSAYAFYDGERVRNFDKRLNADLLHLVGVRPSDCLLAVERIQSFGMAVGEEVFETVRFEARFQCAWGDGPFLAVPRMKVKLHHCHDSRARDPHIRQALLDRFGPGQAAAVGTKKKKGPLYGVSGDVWSAVAIATATWDVCQAHGWDLDRVRVAWLGQKQGVA